MFLSPFLKQAGIYGWISFQVSIHAEIWQRHMCICQTEKMVTVLFVYALRK